MNKRLWKDFENMTEEKLQITINNEIY